MTKRENPIDPKTGLYPWEDPGTSTRLTPWLSLDLTPEAEEERDVFLRWRQRVEKEMPRWIREEEARQEAEREAEAIVSKVIEEVEQKEKYIQSDIQWRKEAAEREARRPKEELEREAAARRKRRKEQAKYREVAKELDRLIDNGKIKAANLLLYNYAKLIIPDTYRIEANRVDRVKGWLKAVGKPAGFYLEIKSRDPLLLSQAASVSIYAITSYLAEVLMRRNVRLIDELKNCDRLGRHYVSQITEGVSKYYAEHIKKQILFNKRESKILLDQMIDNSFLLYFTDKEISLNIFFPLWAINRTIFAVHTFFRGGWGRYHYETDCQMDKDKLPEPKKFTKEIKHLLEQLESVPPYQLSQIGTRLPMHFKIPHTKPPIVYNFQALAAVNPELPYIHFDSETEDHPNTKLTTIRSGSEHVDVSEMSRW